MTKILLGNFPQYAQAVSAVDVDDEKKKIRFQVGYDFQPKNSELLTNALSSFFVSLLVHEQIYVSIDDFYDILAALGSSDTTRLLERKILRLVMSTENNAIWQHDLGNGVLSLSGVSAKEEPMARFERVISSSKTIRDGEKPSLIQYVDNAQIGVPAQVYEVRTKELKKDLKSGIFRELGITTESTDNVNATDAIKLLRIADITEQLILQNQLGLDSIVQDGFVKHYLDYKLGAFAPRVQKDTLSPFAAISKLKGVPDLYNLYKRGTITMENVLECREAFSGGLFRKWYSSTDYDEQEILRALVNKGAKEKPLIKFARMLYPNVLGLMGPVTGLVASAIDSYIVGKIIEGWHPSLFLDDVFKGKIDQYIAKNEASEKRKEIVQRYGKVDRNALCPCQSGKKFKRCHGN